ncbi:hypothetical protein LWI29_024703 [Acer saccharum]|uniref:Uncharacterized protein n=1 Tax=Acer saccharum TaxID=4024 RepID=A0AA39RQK0_ACESA|nr:hypothetical protein LWI29_024703 [Acer saccharum]
MVSSAALDEYHKYYEILESIELMYYEEPIYGELAYSTKNQEEWKKVVLEGSRSSRIPMEVKTSSKNRSRFSRFGVDTFSKVSDSSGREGLAAFVVDSFRGKEEEDESCDLISIALTVHQAKMGKREGAPSASLAPLEPLGINRATKPLYPIEEIGEEFGLSEDNLSIGENFTSIDLLVTPAKEVPNEFTRDVLHGCFLIPSNDLPRQQVGEGSSSEKPPDSAVNRFKSFMGRRIEKDLKLHQ